MKKYKAAVIGLGFIGVAHVEALRRLGNVDVVAVCTKTNPKKKAEALFVDRYYSDYNELLEKEELDFIHICTPDELHYDIAKKAILKKINVLVEKPFTLEVEHAEELYELATKNSVIHAVAFHNRLYPATTYMKEYIKEKGIGDIVSIHGTYIQDWLLFKDDYSWRLEGPAKTRVTADIGSHYFDLLEYVTGLKVTEVFSQYKTIYDKRLKPKGGAIAFSTEKSKDTEEITIKTEDIATVMYKLSNGAIGTVILSQVYSGQKNGLKINIAGNKQSLSWDLKVHNDVLIGNRTTPNEIITKDFLMMSNVKDLIDFPSGHSEGYPDTFKQLFKEVYNQSGNHYATFKEGLRQVRVTEAIYQSNIQNKWIKIEG